MEVKTHQKYQSLLMLADSPWTGRRLRRMLMILGLIFLGALFLPWTQNIQTSGSVTTLLPNQRPQEIQSIIAGRIEKWYVREGDYVRKGDTIVRISEIKESYLDPKLLEQTNTQIRAKENSIESYSSKIGAINRQITQLELNQEMKTKQAVNKVSQEELRLRSERAELDASKTAENISRQQFARDSALQIKGIKSPVEVENRRVKWQESTAKRISAENKVQVAVAALENAKFELRNINAEYGEKLAKAESERFSAVSSQMEAEGEVSKLRNSYSNYSIRSGFYIIMAPQDGYVTKTMAAGIGETVKDGQGICTIMPSAINLAVEMYVEAMDMPLIKKGQKVNFVFDGWPTIVFSGWPEFTYGTFPGRVFAIDNIPSNNGKYRILVAPDYKMKQWPTQLRVGAGTHGYLLLNRVGVWYEIWRQLNGFPPDYYKNNPGEPKIKKAYDNAPGNK
jgi:multidrug resistance efflux pump